MLKYILSLLLIPGSSVVVVVGTVVVVVGTVEDVDSVFGKSGSVGNLGVMMPLEWGQQTMGSFLSKLHIGGWMFLLIALRATGHLVIWVQDPRMRLDK